MKILSEMQLRFEKYKIWHWQNLGLNVSLYFILDHACRMTRGWLLFTEMAAVKLYSMVKISARISPPHPPSGLNSGSPFSIHNLNLTLPEKIVGICYVVLCSHYFGCMKWTSQWLLYSGWYQILSSNQG